MRAVPAALAALVLCGGAVLAARPQSPSPAVPVPELAARARAGFDRGQYDIPHRTFSLDNGLTLIVHSDHAVPVVAVNLWYHVGSRNEQPGKTGFAHLFEHFFFNGSENYPHGFREAMDDLGANNRNGTTSVDRTNFFEDVPVAALERTLYLEADRMGFLAGQINEAMLTRERGVVQNEKRQGENQPYGRVFTRLVQRVYPASHPYSWPTIGSMEDLEAASLADVQAWYRAFYGPGNCVLSLAGDITPERALELVTRYFGGIPPGPPVDRLKRWVPTLDTHIRDSMIDQVPQTAIVRVWHAPAWRDADLQHLQLFADVLSGSRSARLDRRLVDETELATRVSAQIEARELSSLVVVSVDVRTGVDPAAAETEVDRVIAELVEQGPTEAELQRAQSRVLARHVRGTERLGGFGGRSDVLAQSATFDGRSDGYLDRLERLATATPGEVRLASQRWLRAPHYTLIVDPAADRKAAQVELDRSVLPPLGDPPDVTFPALQRATLANGLKVVLLERHGAPLVNVSLAVDAGYAADSAETAGLASLALAVLDEGTASRDSYEIVDALDALGASISTGSSLDLSLVRLQALADRIGPALDIFADVVLRASFPADRVALAKTQRLATIAQERATPVAATQRIVPGLLYGPEHGYGLPLTGSGFERTVTALTRDDLAAWHRRWFHPNNSTVVVTGDTTLAAIVPELERVFGDWPAGVPPTKRIDPVAGPAPGRVYLVDKPGAEQSVIVAAHLSEPGGAPDDLAIETVMRNFGGMSTSRLNRNLRLDKHWSYGTQAALVAARGQRPLLVIAPVQTDKTIESILEVRKELSDAAGARPVQGEEYASIMRTQTLGLPGRWATLAALESAALQILNYGYPDDYFSTYAARVRNLDEAELAAAAARVIDPEAVIWLIVGDLPRIEAGVRELGLGEVTVLQPQETESR